MRTLRTAIVCALTLVTTLAGIGVAPAQGEVDSARLRRAVSTAGIMQHLKAFQKIADDNGGIRSSGTRGYKESVDYVVEQLKKAGYKVTRQEFTYDLFEERSPAVLEQVSPNPKTYTVDEDFITMEYSGDDNVTATLQAVDGILIPSPGGSQSGCAAGDFASFVPGNIALIQRGSCTFRTKAENAAAAGAAGVVIFNEGNNAERQGPINGTLDPPQMDIPVVGASFAVGKELFELGPGVTVHLKVDAHVVTTQTENVIADTKTGNPDQTVVVGAHLDSVPEGSGINDNGSGSAVILEIAEQMAKLKIKPENRVRFAFWGAEESGLIGSEHYVASLSDEEFDQIFLNLNFDMLGSPNYVRFVYDGDGSDTPNSGPAGSAAIEAVFLDYFDSQDLPTEPTAFDGRSDYGPFIAAGVPAGGLFSGAEGIKAEREQNIYDGAAGLAYDPCYHQACDTLRDKDQAKDVRQQLERAYGKGTLVGNVNKLSVDELADAAAHATLVFAQTTEDISATARGARRVQEPQYKGPFALR